MEFARVRNRVWNFILNASMWQLLVIFGALALLSMATEYAVVGFFYVFLLTYLVSPRKDQKYLLPYLLILIIPMEVFGRMLGADPYMPWELGKYIAIPLMMHALITQVKVRKGRVGLWIIILSVPAVLLSFVSSETFFKDFVFSYLGLFNLGLAVIYFSNTTLTTLQIVNMFRLFMAGAFSILVYVVIQAPDLGEMDFSLAANFRVTAGFGSNQVATILATAFGLGIFLWLVRFKLFNSLWFSFGVPGVFLLWSIITFSRGGVVTSLIAIVLIVFFSPKGRAPFTVRRINPSLVVTLGVIIMGLAYYANQITKGQLLLRYSGETYATVYANKEKDLSTLTSSRSDIFLSDIEVWRENFFFGVGIGNSDDVRGEMGYDDTIAHVEISRILSEHGLFGVFIVLIFLLSPVFRYFQIKASFQTALVLMCFTIAIMTSIHSAMRTFTTPLFYGLAFANVLVTKSLSTEDESES